MCGISGILSSKPINSKALEQSLSAIKHRGPDDTLAFNTGTFSFISIENLSSKHTLQHYPISKNVSADGWLGFNRLSIVDISPNGMQPFYDDKTGNVFLMNGEVYNYLELKRRFLSNENFTSETDSEVAFKLYLFLGDDFVKELQGMFTIIIYNKHTQTLKVWRDRLGQKPFYYTLHNECFIFSSEMKGIFATNLLPKEIDFTGLSYSMFLGTCPSPKTIYKNVQSLQAGHCLTYNNSDKKIFTKPYWVLQYKPEESVIEAEEILVDMNALAQLHLTGDVKKGIMLSGGIDSGMLAQNLAQHDNSLQAFHIFAKDHITDEQSLAIENAKSAHLKLKNISIPKSITKATLQQYFTSEEEPNFMPEPAYFLSEAAHKEGFKVLYNALGPDELFGGYDYYTKIQYWSNKFKALHFLPNRIFPKNYQAKIPFIKKYGLEVFGLLSKQIFSWAEIVDFLNQNNEPVPQHPIDFIMEQVMALYPDWYKLPLLKKVSWLDFYYYVSSHHSFRSDQPSMRFSIEMRFPFLDHLFIEKYFNNSYLYKGILQNNKPTFRKAANLVLPNDVLTAGKKGFRMPTEQWLQMPNSSLADAGKTWYKQSLEAIAQLKING